MMNDELEVILDEMDELIRRAIDAETTSQTIEMLSGMTIEQVAEGFRDGKFDPKQEELESKIKVLIEAYKQEDGAYSNPENDWISGFVEDLENLVEEKPLYYALVKGHELLGDGSKYWSHNKYDPEDFFISYDQRDDSPIVVKNTKNRWNELGINDSNADFVRVDD